MKIKYLTLFFLMTWRHLFTAVSAQDVPLIDRALFFGNPEISSGQLSPDGKWISFLKEYNGIMNIWIKRFDEPFDKARPLTDSPRPLYGYFWSYDSRYILYIKDKDGDENINVFAVDPMEPVEPGRLPESRNLTPLKDVQARILHVSRNNPDLLMVEINDRDKAWHDLYTLSISTGELKKIYENTERITGYFFDWDDRLRLLSRTDEKGNTTLYRYDPDGTLHALYETNVNEQAYPYGWTADNTQFYLVTNKGDLDLSTLFLMNPQTGAMTLVESDPLKRVDFGELGINTYTRKIIYTSYTDDKPRYYWKDKKWESNYLFLKKKFPGREISFQSATLRYDKFLIATWGDKYVPEVYFFDFNTQALIYQYTPRPQLKKVEAYLAEMKPIRYRSSDGFEIPAYLTLPVGKKTEQLPMVVLVHGGPKGPRDYWGYDAEVQFLANRGYAVLQPNFRASGGYGKKFMNAGDLQWGKLMQDDITWGVMHLIEQGIAAKGRVAIMGGSYGGYATLAGLAFTPHLYACGVDIVGPSNLFTLLESIPPYWEAYRAYLYAMVGDPNTEEGQRLIREASPLFSVDKISKPLLIVQGANDPRVKKAESDQIVIALREKGKKVSYLLADDEGHGFAKPVNRMAMYAEIERFLAEILGGRYQEDMPEDVAKRLRELTVDIQTVTYTPKQAAKAASALPALRNRLKPGTFHFDMILEFQGQTIPMSMTRTIVQKNNGWLVRDETKGMMGDAVDEIEYTSELAPLRRSISQMGQQIQMSVDGNKIQVQAMGKNFSLPVQGAFITDGPGLDYLIAGLPLQTGYTLTVEMPDLTMLKNKTVTVSVVGQESVQGIPCTRVHITNEENEADQIQLWINAERGYAEKMIQTLPAMGNARLTIVKK